MKRDTRPYRVILDLNGHTIQDIYRRALRLQPPAPKTAPQQSPQQALTPNAA